MTHASQPIDEPAKKTLQLGAAFQALGMLPVLILIALMFQLLSGRVESGSWRKPGRKAAF